METIRIENLKGKGQFGRSRHMKGDNSITVISGKIIMSM
jgi:hypothetical protein